MAIDLFGVVYTDVIEQLPSNMSKVSATSTPLSISNIENFIELGAAQINGLLQRVNVALPLQDDVTLGICKQAVVSYACYKCMSIGSNPQDARINMFLEEFNSAKKMLKESPNELGDEVSTSSRIHSNITKNKTTKFRGVQW